MPRSLLLGLALLATTLLGANTPVLLNAPTVVVYPLQVNGGLEPEIGSRISVLLATSISALGGVSVKPAPPGTVQSDYLSTARKLGVDYYISGFITPLGQEASAVEQVVSALSGSVVWSNTALLSTYGDAQGQGTNLRGAILAHAGRAFASLDAGPPPAPPNPQATAKEANLQILGPKKNKGEAPVATTAAPSKFAVLAMGGTADTERKAYATSSVLRALKKHRVTAALSTAATQDATSSANAICAQTGASVLLGGTLLTQSADPASATTANIVVTAFDCTGHQIGEQTASRDANGKRGWQVAIDRAIDAAVNDYLTKRTTGG